MFHCNKMFAWMPGSLSLSKKKAGLRLLMCYFFLSAWETEAIILWDDVDWSAVAYSDCDTACFNWWSALMAEFSLHHILYEASSNTN